jgi:cystathionine beta-lyase
LVSHPNHDIAQRQQRYPGGVVAFDLVDDRADWAHHLVCNTQLFQLAESLGGVKSLVCLPSAMTHKSSPPDRRYASGVTNSLIRLSVGLEDARDLIHDLEQALASIPHLAVSSQITAQP